MKAKIATLLCLLFMAVACHAQSADKLFASGVKCQQTMTVASQNQAINYFTKARACYDSKAKKDLCTQQITACRNIIKQLNSKKSSGTTTNKKQQKKPAKKQPQAKSEDKLTSVDTKPEPQVEKRNVTLSLAESYLKFKGNEGEFQKVKVNCNYDDWKIAEIPVWVNCSRNEENEVIVEVKKNITKKERSGNVIITCDDKSVNLVIIQERYKKFGLF